MKASASHNISKIAAKTVARLTIVLIATPIILYFIKKDALTDTITFPHPWAIVAPILLLLSFVILLFLVLRDKYSKTDFNWLLTLSAVILSLYLIMLYSRIFTIL